MLTLGKYVVLDQGVLGYIATHSSLGADPVIQELRAETGRLGEAAVMQLNLEAGGLLMLLVAISGARKVLELGTFTGFSTMCLAKGLLGEGMVITCDRDARWSSIARRYWEKAGVADRIDARNELAEDFLRRAPRNPAWDLIFVDADKENYPLYYEQSINLLKVGGILVMDNALRHGDVVKPRNGDERAVALTNMRIAQDSRLRNVIVPVGDGLQICWKAVE